LPYRGYAFENLKLHVSFLAGFVAADSSEGYDFADQKAKPYAEPDHQ
jgi:hypothetical protein